MEVQKEAKKTRYATSEYKIMECPEIQSYIETHLDQMDNTQETLNDDGHSNAESIQISPNRKADSIAQNQQNDGNTEYPKWKVCLISVLAVSLFLYQTNLVFLIPAALKCLPTSERAAYFFLTSPTYSTHDISQ
ncbi:uncharacterized protein LOC132752519 [Ruditapes philippinarum]|uniref:uncharacterized protein LOC132752519 n=1 Tax=Ruditapes philippinarum TaxID=129788 RepID=UPI00295BC46C|nr:uncharacterized protein LOC132752519 [Ruditapes philippinarum]